MCALLVLCTTRKTFFVPRLQLLGTAVRYQTLICYRLGISRHKTVRADATEIILFVDKHNSELVVKQKIVK